MTNITWVDIPEEKKKVLTPFAEFADKNLEYGERLEYKEGDTQDGEEQKVWCFVPLRPENGGPGIEVWSR